MMRFISRTSFFSLVALLLMTSDSDIGDSQDGVAKTKGIMALIGKFELGILFYIPLWNKISVISVTITATKTDRQTTE